MATPTPGRAQDMLEASASGFRLQQQQHGALDVVEWGGVASSPPVGRRRAEPALPVDAVGEASLHAPGATLVPIVLEPRLAPEPARVLRHLRSHGASDVLVRPGSAEPAALVDAIGVAAKTAPGATAFIVVVRDHRLVREGAPLHLAVDGPVLALAAAEAAAVVFAVGPAAQAPVDPRAPWLPVVGHSGLVGEVALSLRRLPRILRARHAVMAAEPTLHVRAVRPTTDLALRAVLVPIEGRLRRHHECAVPPRPRLLHLALDGPVLALAAAKAAAVVLSIGSAAQAPIDLRAMRLPIIGHHWLIGEVAQRPRGVPSGRRARHAVIAAESALGVSAVRPATHHTLLAVLVPKYGVWGSTTNEHLPPSGSRSWTCLACCGGAAHANGASTRAATRLMETMLPES
eukprot:CAMPEP_0176036824 /NCGR_PEP_ID=MMETSP0120_2-20121206/18239_1 /TAXON_ID=160619 /ORGANISM="Kryptoperidinium foliaceum, Strain CCMP 1326" /LENGTH=401 /DNA_ID=CAMNT_0017370211 /DNA_START=253 /DNA_END=1460 /DNA_ORIENTATION=+